MHEEISAEQAYIDSLFARLDREVARARERLREIDLHIDPANPKAEALVRRETDHQALSLKLDRLYLAELGLVFGRIDVAGERRYVGRMGLDAPEDGYRTLLLDWRAPAARPFYLATTAHPEGVTLRRHIRMRGRDVIAVDDERLSGPGTAEDHSGIAGEAALFQAITSARTGRMRSIVETIQREQDEIIRDDARGTMIVQGGPGTGKTAVALHRAAYLLYTWREQLERTGVLIVGPNHRFLDYISRVLPELGETGVVLTTVGELYPGIVPTRPESALAREVKGSAEMVHILKQAVRDLETLPVGPRTCQVDQLSLDVSAAMVRAARTRARRSRRPHNQAQSIFREYFVEKLAEQLAERIGADPLGGANLLSRADIDQLHDDLAEEPSVNDLVDEFWPILSPERVLRRLTSSRAAINSAAVDYDEETRAALLDPAGGTAGWAASDAALLDELAELIGPPPENREHARDSAVARAQAALDVLEGSAVTDNDEYFDPEYLGAYDVIDAATLAERHEEADRRSTAERAAADRSWAFGHVIVDEAQELTPMEWRMVARRCPSRWMTLVGDTAQTGAPAGVDSWEDALGPIVGNRFRVRELTVNYRTPRPVMDYAARILEEIDPGATPPTAIRDGEPVRFLPAGTDPASLRFEDDRSVRIITADTVAEIKGLEFDHVIIDSPGRIVAASPQGLQDLYVAATRATQTLTVIGD